MSTKFYVIAVWTLLSFVVKVNAQDKVECWDRFELSFKQVTKGNPFDTRLSATFVCGKEKKTVEGFYDGENTYRIRFMPAVAGEWRYVTSSSIGAMNDYTYRDRKNYGDTHSQWYPPEKIIMAWCWWTENIILNMRTVPVIIRWVRRPMHGHI